MPRSTQRDFRCLFRGLLLAAALASLALASCSQTLRGEFGVEACRNGQDDDRDDRVDCDDADCWVFCPTQPQLSLGDPSSQWKDARVPDATASGPDGGRRIMLPNDAGRSTTEPDPEDAGVPSSCTCATDEACVDGQCRARDLIAGEYDISVLAAFVPLYTPNNRCFDYSNSSCVQRIALVCECVRPDPYVVVLIDSKPLARATTPESLENASPVWPAAPTARATLTAATKLEFVVYDWDGIGTDAEIFRCAPDLSPLSTSGDVLACSPDSSMTIAPPRNANFNVNVSVKRVAP